MRPACCNSFDDNVFIRKSAVGVMFVRSSLSIESLADQANVRLGTIGKGTATPIPPRHRRNSSREHGEVSIHQRSMGHPPIACRFVGMRPASASFIWSPIVIPKWLLGTIIVCQSID
jgi:hypothetical protein